MKNSFSKIFGATAEQTVEEIRGFEVNYFVGKARAGAANSITKTAVESTL